MWSSCAEYKVVIIRKQTVVIIRGILSGHHTEIYSGCHTVILMWLSYEKYRVFIIQNIIVVIMRGCVVVSVQEEQMLSCEV